MANTVQIRSDKGIHPVDKRLVRRLALAILKHLQAEDAELSVYLCSTETIHGLNRDWRGKDRPTDVLSFPQDCLDGPISGPLGDIVLSTDVAVAQAAREGVTYESELLRLLVHGALHLVGYDHETGRPEAVRMRTEEKRILGMMEAERAGIVTKTGKN
ncbi:MAG TPA: rRNA maturation RNase YbeY [Spirochaetota bacterium]|nr:rRNA maturation RNase YbeY [Spirochaetota bacterium]